MAVFFISSDLLCPEFSLLPMENGIVTPDININSGNIVTNQCQK